MKPLTKRDSDHSNIRNTLVLDQNLNTKPDIFSNRASVNSTIYDDLDPVNPTNYPISLPVKTAIKNIFRSFGTKIKSKRERNIIKETLSM